MTRPCCCILALASALTLSGCGSRVASEDETAGGPPPSVTAPKSAQMREEPPQEPNGNAALSKRLVLTFSFRLDEELYEASYYGEPPQLAIWLEDLRGKRIQTVWVSHRTGKGDWSGAADRPQVLPYWVTRYTKETGASGAPTFATPLADAVTGPTPRKAFIYHLPVTPGDRWAYFLEVNVAGDFNERFPATFAGGAPDPAGNGQPSIVYRGEILAEDGATDRPKLIGRTRQCELVDALLTDMEGIDSANRLLLDIKVSCHLAE